MTKIEITNYDQHAVYCLVCTMAFTTEGISINNEFISKSGNLCNECKEAMINVIKREKQIKTI